MSALDAIYRGREPQNNSKGCGGVMRVAPIPLYAVVEGCMNIEEADRLAGDAAEITHLHPLGYIPAALMSHIIYRLALDSEPTQESMKRYIREGGVERMRKLYEFTSKEVEIMADLAEKSILRASNSASVASTVSQVPISLKSYIEHFCYRPVYLL